MSEKLLIQIANNTARCASALESLMLHLGAPARGAVMINTVQDVNAYAEVTPPEIIREADEIIAAGVASAQATIAQKEKKQRTPRTPKPEAAPVVDVAPVATAPQEMTLADANATLVNAVKAGAAMDDILSIMRDTYGATSLKQIDAASYAPLCNAVRALLPVMTIEQCKAALDDLVKFGADANSILAIIKEYGGKGLVSTDPMFYNIIVSRVRAANGAESA